MGPLGGGTIICTLARCQISHKLLALWVLYGERLRDREEGEERNWER